MSPKVFILILIGAFASIPAMAQNVLTGDTRLACEAILCLATGTQPDECAPSLQRYFGISHKKMSDTIRDRTAFLKLCPVAEQTPEMASLVNAMGQGAGRCDAASLNATLTLWNPDSAERTIGNAMPSYCAAYTNHQYTDLNTIQPRYVGVPERGGHWVEAGKYEQTLAEYEARIAREDALRATWN
ncbi:MAG: conjugal transfer protein TrbM [Azoarcus sp.]|jgi:hypothetical protein|nr:conjugal transfer protein TrbM [Azoarcus sp.]